MAGTGRRPLLFAALAGLMGAMPRAAVARSDAAAMTDAAGRFLAAAAADPRARLAWDDPRRTDWHWFPPRLRPVREGIPLGAMGPGLRRAAEALLEASTTAPGAAKARAIISLQHELRQDPGAYFVTVYGMPGDGHWGWGIEGHHLSLNYAVRGDLVAAGPIFLGAHPTRVEAGPRAGLRALQLEEEAPRQALASLPAELRARVIVAERTPFDTITQNAPQAAPLPPAGVTFAELPAEARGLLGRALDGYLEMMPRGVAAAERARRDREGPHALRFAWMGATVPDRFHYWRLQGEGFLVEHDNSRDGARHIHSVWRGIGRDFGAAL